MLHRLIVEGALHAHMPKKQRPGIIPGLQKLSGAPWRIRTVDLGIRSPLLYPTELMEHKAGHPSECKFARLINYSLLELVVVRLADLIHGTIHA